MRKVFIFITACFLCIFIFSFSVFAESSESIDTEDDSGIISGLLDGLKGLFIPDEDFFEDFKNEIFIAIDEKTGGLATSFTTMMDSFNNIDGGNFDGLFVTFKDNHFYPGYKGKSVNVLSGIGTFISWFKAIFSAFLAVTTVIYCYRKVSTLFKQ